MRNKREACLNLQLAVVVVVAVLVRISLEGTQVKVEKIKSLRKVGGGEGVVVQPSYCCRGEQPRGSTGDYEKIKR